MTSNPNFDLTRPQSFEAIVLSLLCVAVVALVIERALTVVYALSFWSSVSKFLRRYFRMGEPKLWIAVFANVAFAAVVRLDFFAIMTGTSASLLGVIITGLFNAGGGKAWADMIHGLELIRNGKVEALQASTRNTGAMNRLTNAASTCLRPE